MGRSQVKYRTTHGRRRGRGGAQYDGTGERSGASKKGRSSHLRNLGSNAYRFEEHEEQDDGQVADYQSQGGQTQFFASEQQYRETMGSTRGEYFQSRVMKQWEKDDAADDYGAVGMMDLNYIALQLKLVSPSIRYRMDPKYCTDLPFEPQDEDDRESDQHVATEKLCTAIPVTVPSKPAQGDEELDFLLNLSASTSSGAESTLSPSLPWSAPIASTKTAAESEQLEEWLDDVLDM